MVRITVGGEDLDLPKEFTLSIEDTSPIFNDIGSQSIGVSVPDTMHNRRILGFPRRPDATGSGSSTSVGCMVVSGSYVRTGILNTDSASDEGISVSIGFDNSMAYEAWSLKRLSEVKSLPCYRFRDMTAVETEMLRLYAGADPQVDDLAIFPICIGEEEVKEKIDGEAAEGEMFFEILNHFQVDHDIFLPGGTADREVKRVFDGCEAMITVPNGYGCTPFVRVWRILEAIFEDLGLKMDKNPFREDVELARLVVLNNTADTLCACTLDYAELMPDCTVEEFLHSLLVRFGFIYRTDFDKGSVDVCLVKDIMGKEPSLDLDPYLTKNPDSEFRVPQYVRLAANTSIEGTAPFTDRLEDYITDYSLFSPEEPEEVLSAAVTLTEQPDLDFWPIERNAAKPETLYQPFWEGRTGILWRQDLTGWGGNDYSSSFFTWDPKPDGCEPMDLISVDNCCPIRKIGPYKIGNNAPWNYYWPAFTVGARHRHTRTKTNDSDSDNECPLSYMFALTGLSGVAYSEGFLSAFRDQDEPPEGFGDGTYHDLSLFFQYRIGHYAKFWNEFDRRLRRADRRIKTTVRIRKSMLRVLDVLSPVRLGGIPMLIDTADIVIGDGPETLADIVLVPMMAPADGDDSSASEVPDFPPQPPVLSEQEDDL